jgi:RsiW-degrading membrane proteinase PrsW (M82 family)
MQDNSLGKVFLFLGCLAVGNLAGLLSLLASLLFQALFSFFIPADSTFWLVVFSILEELLKLIVLFYFLTTFYKVSLSWKEAVFGGVFLGIGFALFELMLIFIQNTPVSFLALFLLFTIHGGTSTFLGLGIWSLKQTRRRFLTAVLIGLPIILHLCYNGFVEVFNRF